MLLKLNNTQTVKYRERFIFEENISTHFYTWTEQLKFRRKKNRNAERSDKYHAEREFDLYLSSLHTSKGFDYVTKMLFSLKLAL